MASSAPSILALVEILLSRGMSPEMSLSTAKAIDEVFGISTRYGGSTPEQRDKWRLKKQRQRDRMGNVPGGQSGIALIEVNNNTKKLVKKSKSETKQEGTVPGDKTKRSKGDVLSPDWAPTESHYAKGATLGMTRTQVDGYADRMRNWAEANAHRQVARKAGERGWNAAFMNWLCGAAERNGGGIPNATNRNGSSNLGFAGLAASIRHGAGTDARRPAPEDLEPVNGR